MINLESLGRYLLWLSRIICGLILAVVLAAPATALARQPVGAPQLMLGPDDGLFPAAMMQAHLDVDVVGDHAEAVFEQAFSNPTDQWMEAVYLLPVPDRAGVRGLTIEFDGRRIVGRIVERQDARREYQQAVATGRGAGLLESLQPDLFHVRAANIPPGGEVVVRVHLSMPVEQSGDWMSLRFPMTITPKYRGADAVAATSESAIPVHAQPWADWHSVAHAESPMVVPPWRPNSVPVTHPLTWRVNLRSHGKVVRALTPYHAASIGWQRETLVLKPRHRQTEMDRDLVVRWRLASESRPVPSVLASEFEGQYFADLALLPPQPEAFEKPQPRDLVLVLDASGSMAGESLRQAIAAVGAAIEQLRPEDRFDIVAFESDTTTLFGELAAVTPASRQQAMDFLGGLRAEGGTEMLPALTRATSYPADGTARVAQIIFVTDGAVYEESALLQLLQQQLGDTRLFTVAIGSAPNTRFMRMAADIGRGLHRHIARLEDVAPVLDDLLWRMSHPLLTDVVVHWPQPVELASAQLPDLYPGEPLKQRARMLSPPSGGDVEITGLLNGWPWRATVALPFASNVAGSGAAQAAGWARARVDDWLDLAAIGAAPADIVREEVISLGLAYDLATPFTSFVAVEEVISRPPSVLAGTYQIPSAVPAGQLRYAQTGTGVTLWLYFGLAALLLGALTWVAAREGASS